MANEIIDDLLPEVSHDPTKSEVKGQKLIECVLTGNSTQYLGKAYTEQQRNNKLKHLVLKKWISFLTSMKLSSQAKW